MDFLKNVDINGEFLDDLKLILEKKTLKGEVDSENPFGKDMTEGLKCALEIAERYGFTTKNLDNYVGYAEYGCGEDYVGILGHLDVVPVGEGWNSDPFIPLVKDGKIFGRGTSDDKGPIFAALYALKLMKEHGVKLSKKVRIIFGTNEETGTEDMDYYLKKEKPPVAGFTPDAEFPIVTSEKGILTFQFHRSFKETQGEYKVEYIKGGKRSNIVPDCCKCKIAYTNQSFLEYFKDDGLKEKYKIEVEDKSGHLIIIALGIAAHGSTPQCGDNAISNLLLYLNEAMTFKDDFTDFLRDFNSVIAKEYNGKKLGIDFQDEESGKLTLNLGIIDGNEKEVSMRFNVRYPVTIKLDDILNSIDTSLSRTEFEFQMGHHNAPLHFPKDHDLVKALQKAYEEATGEEAKLLAMGGGTYAKLMPNIVAFGPLFEDDENLAHEVNEYIKLDTLKKCVEIYGRAIYELAK
ncbi:MAG: dipeptidase PepV [Clostridium sp.]|uniref:dipeptidase PepV n=1 Tax=Clostridium sp. TaxID=1506 RepID=UPI002A8605FD|nr:dipeptidase PepV [Clostridium sp.]MDY5097156.1 dipeptidase PepV [Clostridium sp.]